MTHEPVTRQSMARTNEGADSADSSAGFGHLVSEHRVHRSVYLDEAVFQAELESIFGRRWIYVGHQSQVPTPGSFTTSWSGLKVESAEWLPILRGLRRTEVDSTGARHGQVTDEHPQRGFYRRWLEAMQTANDREDSP